MKTSDLRSEVIQFLSDVEQGQGHKSTTKPSNPVPYPAPLKQCQTVVSTVTKGIALKSVRSLFDYYHYLFQFHYLHLYDYYYQHW